ncbi:MAG: alanine--glyoxylate aminotransferase family protein [Gemmatimonadetes bacterium]|nr:alanine--glyoxylate aminotransferase family protein [Gemmatimonadota bacterium]
MTPTDLTPSPSPSPRPSPAQPFGRFFLPGPTEVRPEILQAQVRPMIGHRARAMEELLGRMQPLLQYLFRTRRLVYVSTSSATGLMEAAVRNGARRRVLSLVNGAFSERFFRIARACGFETSALEVPLGHGHTPEMLEDALRAGDYDTITVVHSETSTGVLDPIAELASVAHNAGDVALLVDSVSALAGTPVETDAWGLDFVLTGSQKALALPPGLALGVAQETILKRAERNPARGVYFDFLEFEKNLAKNQTPNTPAVSLLYALDAQLQRIREETLERRIERHAAMARRTWEWVDAMRDRGIGLEVLAPPGFRSPTVTCIRLPEAMKGSEISARMRERGFTIASGYGPLKDTTIRIGHMGDHTVEELNELLAILEHVVTKS